MLEEGSYNRGISVSKLVNGLLLLLAWKTFLFGFRSTTFKTSYDVSRKKYEADVKTNQSCSIIKLSVVSEVQ